VAVAVAAVLATGRAEAEEFVPQLTAFELAADQVHPGDAIVASFEFVNTGTAPASGEATVFAHVRRAAPGEPDVPPSTGGDFQPITPTFVWLPQTVVRHREQRIRIPNDFPPGQYRLLIGLFDPSTGQRYELANADLASSGNRYRVATFEVVARDKKLAGKPVSIRWRETSALPDAEDAWPRQAAGEAITLDSGRLRVKLAASTPVVVGYELPGGKTLGGDASGYPLRVRIHSEREDKSRVVCLTDPACFSLRHEGAEARYAVAVRDKQRVAAQFDVVFRVEGTLLRAGVENVREEAGYLLMDVLLPQLVSTRGPAGQLVVPTDGGRLVHLDQTSPGRRVIAMNWFDMDLCGAVVGEGCAAAIRTRDWDNELDARVAGAKQRVTGGYAARLALRAEAHGKAAHIRLAETPGVEVALVETANEPAAWIAAAKWLRKDLSGTPDKRYQNTVIYKVFCDTPKAKDFTTFDEALGVIRKMHELAPWLKQVVYLVGWQFQGHDTGYPATDQFNARLGGLDGLRRVAAEAARYNAVLSYHDNFDDAYRDSPQWDETVIARNSRGELQKGGVWAGGQSYILAFKKYAQKAGIQRVQRTVAQMPVRESYHIDVLSAVPLRRDYNSQSPENTRDSLEGKLAIIREFNRLGIDVTSEGFTAPFVGILGHGWHFWYRNERFFAGDEPIPFVPMIYHGGPTTYGRGGDLPTASFCPQSVLYGATYARDWTKHTDPHIMADALYLIVTPWTYLRDRKMQDYQRQGTLRRVIYGPDTFVEVNEANGQWRVVVDGRTLIENDLAIVEKKDLVAVFARTARQATIKLPAGFQSKSLTVTNACTGEDITSRAKIDAAEVRLDLPASEPLLIRPRRR
jgi:hypothetical protein